jgi:2-iminobutanoate/2-iminopropanoate deaminase
MKSSLCNVAAAFSIALCAPFHAAAQALTPSGVKTLSPAGAIKPTGTWSLGTRAGDFVFIAGM